MARHKYKVGQLVVFVPGKLAMPPASRAYKIICLLPTEHGEPQYRIKGNTEAFERMARESELSQR